MIGVALALVFACRGAATHVDTAADGRDPGTGSAALEDEFPLRAPERAIVSPAPGVRPGRLPNIVVVMSDDQRADTLWAMPNVLAQLGGQGVTFSQARASSPLCCPARASFLSGGYRSSRSGVLGNIPPNGSVSAFAADRALPVRMQGAGYTTALIGKYLNQYGANGDVSIPPGWSTWLASGGFGSYWNYNVVRGSSGQSASTGATEHGDRYLTDFLFDEAVFFAQTAPEPFFLVVAAFAPHSPYQPAPGDEGVFDSYTFRGPGFMEEDLSDKPPWPAPGSDVQIADEIEADNVAHGQLELLLPMDRGVDALLDAIANRGLEDSTVVTYFSDNGYLWGEHRLIGKGMPYGPAVSVPLVVRGPGFPPRQVSTLVSANLDLAATIQELAGLPVESDGVSLLSILQGGDTTRLDPLVIELAEPTAAAFVSVEVEGWRLILWSNNEIEFYDLVADPGEEENLAQAPPLRSPFHELLATAQDQRPLVQRVEAPIRFTRAKVQSYKFQAVGGQVPLTWTVALGLLPPGLTLNPTTGVLSGIPLVAGTFNVEIAVTDSNISPFTGVGQSSIVTHTLAVDERPPELRRPPEIYFAGGKAGLELALTGPANLQWSWAADPSMEGAESRSLVGFEQGRLGIEVGEASAVYVEVLAGAQRLWSGWVGAAYQSGSASGQNEKSATSR